MVRTSFTPGAACATKSKVLASGPIRATRGTFSCRRRYSFSDSSVCIDMAKRLGAISLGVKSVSPTSKKSARLPLASTSPTSVRLPWCAASNASAAAIVVLPTPPLPVTNSNCRSSRLGPDMRRCAGGLRCAEADATQVRAGAELDPRELVNCDPDLAALAVRQPEDAVAVGDGLLERPLHRLRVGAVGQLDLDLAGVVGHPDADVHVCSSGRWQDGVGHRT